VLSFVIDGHQGRPHNKKNGRAAVMAGWRLLTIAAIASVCSAQATLAQINTPPSYPCVNDAPDPYRQGSSFAPLPDGRAWGSTAGVAVAPDGTIWAYDRCGANSCAGSSLDPIIAFSPDGKVLRHFGGGMFLMPHGLTVDDAGNVWVTDNAAKDGRGMQVVKFGADGKVLMILGKAGGGEPPDAFSQPNAVAIAANGDIFISQGHTARGDKSLVLVFSAQGKFIRSFGGKGSGPGELDMPHALAFDDKGRLLVGDRNHNRIALFQPDGSYLGEWKQFSRPSAVVVTRDQMLYVGDSESQSRDASAYAYNPGCEKGIRFGKLDDARAKGLIPDQQPMSVSSTAEGVGVDKDGNVFGAEVGPKDLKKFVRK
jgi:DNA-binding beta-propeller fold protein YncE